MFILHAKKDISTGTFEQQLQYTFSVILELNKDQ